MAPFNYRVRTTLQALCWLDADSMGYNPSQQYFRNLDFPTDTSYKWAAECEGQHMACLLSAVPHFTGLRVISKAQWRKCSYDAAVQTLRRAYNNSAQEWYLCSVDSLRYAPKDHSGDLHWASLWHEVHVIHCQNIAPLYSIPIKYTWFIVTEKLSLACCLRLIIIIFHRWTL